MHTLTRSTIHLCTVTFLSGTVGGLVQVTVDIHDLNAAGNESDGWLRDFGKVVSVWPLMTVVFAVFSRSLDWLWLSALAVSWLSVPGCLCPCVLYMPSGLLVDVTQLSIMTSAICFCTATLITTAVQSEGQLHDTHDLCHLV